MPERTESATLPIIQVRCPTWRELAESYADDLASGGLYVARANPLPPLQAVVVQLLLPEATEILLSARVVQVLESPLAEQLGKPPGIALELLDLEGERKRQVVQLIEFARWQGASGDPTSSFARTMLELSPSLPPREVALRLSQLPAARPESRSATPAVQPGRRDSQPGVPAQRPPSRPAMPAARGPSQTGLPAQRPPSQSGLPAQRPPSQPALPAVDTTRNEGSSSAFRAPGASARAAQPGNAARSGSSQSLPAQPRSQSMRSMPAAQPRANEAHVRRESGETLAPHARRDSSQQPAPPLESGITPRDSQSLPVPEASAAASGGTSAKPTDQLKLKLVLSNVAHKHYEAAIAITREMLADNPGDPQAVRWQNVCEARLALQRGETELARRHYEQVLQIDPANREAREFARVHDRDRKLNSLPFGRYFTKKK